VRSLGFGILNDSARSFFQFSLCENLRSNAQFVFYGEFHIFSPDSKKA